jgi:ubiquinone/menaquinone biosynthesis C-methylase UbiE
MYSCLGCGKIVCESCFKPDLDLCKWCETFDPEEATQNVARTYEELAAEYDERIYGPDSSFIPDAKEQVFVETEMEFLLSRVSGQDNVLELGCGTGRITTPIARKVKSVTAVDISPAVLQVALQKAQDMGIAHKITFQQGNLISLPFDNSAFSVVVCALALMHIPRQYRSKAFREMSRVLAPNGRVLISVKNKKFEEISTQDLFGRGDATVAERNEIVFEETQSGQTHRITWNSFSFRELETLFAEHELHVVDMRGNMPIVAWLDNKVLNHDPSLVRTLVQLERVLGNIPPFNHLGYYYLIEAIKVA